MLRQAATAKGMVSLFAAFAEQRQGRVASTALDKHYSMEAEVDPNVAPQPGGVAGVLSALLGSTVVYRCHC